MPTAVSQLVSAAASVAGQAELSDVLRTTVRTAMELTGARYGALGIAGEHGLLSGFIYEGMNHETAEAVGRLPLGRGVLGAIDEEPLRLDQVGDHTKAVGFPEHHPHMISFLGVAVSAGGNRFGNLYLTDKEGGAPFTDEDEVLVVALAHVAGSAIARTRLERRLEHAALVEDRERIARDIHDGVIQELFAVGLSLEATRHAPPAEVARRVEIAMASIDDAMNRLRSYIFDLQLPDPDFEARLRTIISKAAGGAEVNIEISGEYSQLTRLVMEHLSNFVREAVSNAIRHANADTVSVTATNDGEVAIVEVVDDGDGFDPDDAADGLGLANMKERMSELGGLCEVISRPGHGTVARGSVPLA